MAEAGTLIAALREPDTRDDAPVSVVSALAPTGTETYPTHAAVRARPLYFINWWIDSALIGGLSLVVFVAVMALGKHFTAPSILPLTLLLSFPHFSATVYRLYQSPQHIRQFPVTAWGMPFIMTGAVLASLWQPGIVAPYLLLTYFFWSPYHYSGQTVGLTMIYSKRAGFPVGECQRLALTTFVLATFVCSLTRSNGGTPARIFDMSIPLPLFPAWIHVAAQAAMGTAALVFIGYALAWCLERKRVLPPIILLPALTQFIWFIPGTTLTTFLVFVPAFHALQYLMIACVVQLKYRIDVPGAERSWRRIRSEALRWALRNVVGGLLLFYGLPLVFTGFSLPFLTTVGIVAAAVNIHHFFVDGVIWKLRDDSNSSALTMNIAELARGPAGARIALSPVPAGIA